MVGGFIPALGIGPALLMRTYCALSDAATATRARKAKMILPMHILESHQRVLRIARNLRVAAFGPKGPTGTVLEIRGPSIDLRHRLTWSLTPITRPPKAAASFTCRVAMTNLLG